MRVGVLLAAAAVALQPAAARPPGNVPRLPVRETRCDLGGWTASIGNDPIPVHAAPRADARVVGMLPTASAPGIEHDVDFSIVASRDGWLKISDASDAKNEDHARPVYRGTGWIRGSAARLRIQSGRGYARPDLRSERVLDMHGDWLTERAFIVAVVGCSGEWALIDYRFHAVPGVRDRQPAKPYRAWFRGICAVAGTSCDMPSVDRDPASAVAPDRADRKPL